jgi:hypothetical protein
MYEQDERNKNAVKWNGILVAKNTELFAALEAKDSTKAHAIFKRCMDERKKLEHHKCEKCSHL